MDHKDQSDLDRIRRLAAELAATGPGPAAELATELADALAGLSARIDALWQLISAVVESAGLSVPAAGAPPPDFVRARESARTPGRCGRGGARAPTTGRRGVRLSIDGREWVAALSQQLPEADRASWSAIERLARESSDQDEM
jgi:hypothetical protein